MITSESSASPAPDTSAEVTSSAHDGELEIARAILTKYRVAVFIVAYNAEHFIEDVLRRIPLAIRAHFTEIYIIDDHSNDATFSVATDAAAKLNFKNVSILRTPFNRGYGGNQKLGYLHAIKRRFDYVILLHGDAQYPHEYLPAILVAIDGGNADAVVASRMKRRLDALRGRMPPHKWVGNQILTLLANRMLNSSLSEWHSGFRAYKVSTLESIPFQLNSDDFHFDTEIIIQLLATNRVVREIAIPTHYGDEICHVNGISYAWNCIKALVKYRMTQLGLFYQPNFDFGLFEEPNYHLKLASTSLHQFVLSRLWPADWHVADAGSNDGRMDAILAAKVARVVRLGGPIGPSAAPGVRTGIDPSAALDERPESEGFDCVLALDMLEHLTDPERAVERLSRLLKPGGWLLTSTGNVANVFPRISLMCGQFNYGKRGILDLTHTRLFTIYSFKKLLTTRGFLIKDVRYFGPPIVDMIGDTRGLRVLDRVAAGAARLWPGLFAYGFLVVAQRTDNLEEIYDVTARDAPQLR